MLLDILILLGIIAICYFLNDMRQTLYKVLDALKKK